MYYKVNDVDLNIMEYLKHDPEFFEFQFIDNFYPLLKLFKMYFAAQKREDFSYLNIVNHKITSLVKEMGSNCEHCNTTSDTRQEIADAMA